MDNSVLRPDASPHDVLATHARAASDGRLVLDAVGGLCAAVVFVLWRPSGWLIPFGAAVCLFSFGVWGIVDRELGERAGAGGDRMAPLLRAVRAVTVLLGAASAIVAALAALAAALGTWIS